MNNQDQKDDQQMIRTKLERVDRFDEEMKSLGHQIRNAQRINDQIKEKVHNISWSFNDKPGAITTLYDTVDTLLREASHFMHLAETQLGVTASFQIKELRK